jgi:hypothetical protein
VLSVYTCHQHRVKRVAVEPGNHNTWVTASEDGTVRQFDRRVRGMCESVAVGQGLDPCAVAVLLCRGLHRLEVAGVNTVRTRESQKSMFEGAQ